MSHFLDRLMHFKLPRESFADGHGQVTNEDRTCAEQLIIVEIGLACATPALAALGVMIAALTAGLRHGAALGGLLLLPLAVPLLIFGAGSLTPGSQNGLLLLAAASLLLTVICPIAAGAAIRAGRE